MKLKELNKSEAINVEPNDEVIYRIDIPANRYDMLCLEGIARALNIFTARLTSVEYKLADMTGASLTGRRSYMSVRPLSCSVSKGL